MREMTKFLHWSKPPKLYSEEINDLNRPVTNREIETESKAKTNRQNLWTKIKHGPVHIYNIILPDF